MCAVLVLGGCIGSDEDTVMSAVGDPPVVEDRERIETLASGYRAHPAFERQWALGRIGADVLTRDSPSSTARTCAPGRA